MVNTKMRSRGQMHGSPHMCDGDHSRRAMGEVQHTQSCGTVDVGHMESSKVLANRTKLEINDRRAKRCIESSKILLKQLFMSQRTSELQLETI